MNSTLELKWTDRVLTGSQTPRRFLDFVVDGNSLYQKLVEMSVDKISPIGWGTPNEQLKVIDRFLLNAPADFPDERRAICVCGECGDLDCGAISAIIERKADKVVWRDFGFESTYEDEIDFVGYEKIGPFSFDGEQYESLIRSVKTN